VGNIRRILERDTPYVSMGRNMHRDKVDRCQFSDFQKRVYRAVLGIPLGQVRSYNWVAKKIGRPNAVRAVGTALKKNPFTITIPCHRVIKSDGSLGGYSRGIKKKKHLLRLEKKIIDMILTSCLRVGNIRSRIERHTSYVDMGRKLEVKWN